MAIAVVMYNELV